jgi:crotonobetainyl-CoA:carnitine CoA-transferase CaiB-like acyl-CoA transferase
VPELDGLAVVDASASLSGAYCAKLFGDAGATVTLVEPPAGAPMRSWAWDHEVPEGESGALFRYLRHGHRSVTAVTAELIAGADVVILDGTGPLGDPSAFAAAHPELIVVCFTPYGLHGPYADRPATEFTLQADSGALAIRGTLDRPPLQMGGRIAEWVAGAYAGVGALAARRRQAQSGLGELLDVSICEVANVTGSNFSDLHDSLHGRPAPERPARTIELPSIEPTVDGWVGVNTNTREQFDSFCLLIERPDLIDSPDEWPKIPNRQARADEWNAMVREWTTKHTTAEIVEKAALLRIPVAPVSDGEAVLELEQAVARGFFVEAPAEGGTPFTMPGRPWSIDAEAASPPRPAPAVGQHDGEPAPMGSRPQLAASTARTKPLAGVKVLDLTAWWAGPTATGVLATLGAETVHVESIKRMDGMRMSGGMFFGREQWWEYSGFFLSANVNKRGVTIDLNSPAGRDLALRMIKEADLIVENFTPRVMEAFGLDWETVHRTNPRAVLVRMPAFGLTGPWRDRPGFAQTMEQITGLAWLTGFPDDQPRIQRGPCDPNGGLHATWAALLGLAHRDRTGVGCLVEAPMFEAALAVAAEAAIEWSAYGNRVAREGNRSPECAPQGLYATAETEQWLALSVASDEQWRALTDVIGRPDLAADPALADRAGRRKDHDRLDAAIQDWAAPLALDKALEILLAAGIPAAPASDPRHASQHPQMAARGYFETVTHPIVGTHPITTLPWRSTGIDRWIEAPAPTVGQHNHDVLTRWIGCTDAELAQLENDLVIGTKPLGV